MMKLENVVPWGRSFDEYVKMFDLTSDELKLNILDCGGGPSSFNAEMMQLGCNISGNITSCDPIYQFTVEEIQNRIQQTYSKIIAAVKETPENFVWQDITSPDELGEVRMVAMKKFLADLSQGISQKRYVKSELPNLPFTNGKFDLALCSHLLFTYSNILSADFHVDSIVEMRRVASEVRVFPLVTQFSGEISPHLEAVINQLTARGLQVEIRKVDYEFQKGGNQMLWVR
ncbi:SAM-dependent methyltransferase [Calothrix sp. CCY 0018]|uniref:SAM-dependent methyltransferase n=1 Tax=Calothrix sp. CCY 0018 TaxID=3103864 RepID=UPI0039C5AB50